MRTYMIRLEEYGISRERARELWWICRQYDDCRRRAAAIRRGEVDRPARRRNGIWHRPDPTGEQAVNAADNWYTRRVDAIEGAAKAADPALWRYILRNACRGVPFSRLGAPCGVNQFSRARRIFFVELDARV